MEPIVVNGQTIEIDDDTITIDGVEWVPCTLPKAIARLYLYGLTEEERGLRPLRGITQAPILEQSGRIRVADGYDDATGLYCHSVPQVPVPDNPTKEDAEQALMFLRHYFRTFPWGDSEREIKDGISVTNLAKPPGLDESTFLVALLTAVSRQCLDLAPGLLFDAPGVTGSGTGKGLLVRALAHIATGVKTPAFTAGHDSQEMDKRLTAALIEQRPVLFLDNFNGKYLKSDTLASALTEDPCRVRPLGQSKTVPLFTRALVCITGNGVLIAEDMARRLLKVVLDAKMEDPEQRKFKGEFMEDVAADRIRLLTAILTIWRWGRQNDIAAGKPLGSYGKWGRWCRDPLLALGCTDPVDRIAEVKAADPVRNAVIGVFEAWWERHRNTPTELSELDNEVILLIDSKARRNSDGVTVTYNRQYVAGYVNRHIGTTLG
jgi:hypothetical protein